MEGKEEQQQDEHQGDGDNHREGADGILQVLELAAILEVVAGLEFHVLVERLSDLVHHLLNIGIAHIHTDNHASLGGVAVDLQRAVWFNQSKKRSAKVRFTVIVRFRQSDAIMGT